MYFLAGEEFKTKDDIASRCRAIVAATPNGSLVGEKEKAFLFALFHYHEDWTEKAGIGIGVAAITTTVSQYRSRGFALLRNDGSKIDISWVHALRLVPSGRPVLDQRLLDFRAAARNAVTAQINEFRKQQVYTSPLCPVSGAPLYFGNCAVDHVAPNTFEAILFSFCQQRGVKPLDVVVNSRHGTVAEFADKELLAEWQAFHRANAQLRLVSKQVNLQLPKNRQEWGSLLGARQ